MDASRTLARQAARLARRARRRTGDGAPDIAALAARLGVSDRHLRRIFAAEHGVTPVQYLQTRRLLLAKQLLTDTPLPVTQVALASGFRSLRRFNAAFAERYRLSPSALRSDAGRATHRSMPSRRSRARTLGYRPPLRRARRCCASSRSAPIPGIEAVDVDDCDRAPHAARAACSPSSRAGSRRASCPSAAQVRLRFAPALAPAARESSRAVRRWLDLDAAPDAIDAALRRRCPARAGHAPAGQLDGFELAVRAVLGQQVTVAAARTLARRLVERFGAPIATPWPELDRAFPVAGAHRRTHAPTASASSASCAQRARTRSSRSPQAWPSAVDAHVALAPARRRR